MMGQLTVDSSTTLQTRIKADSAFAEALLREATDMFLNGEAEASRLLLRDVVNATVGFEQIALATNRPSKSVHRMLSARGNPTMESLSVVFSAIRKVLNVTLETRIVHQA
ncbi:MAG: transcriptional regulator [Gallionella sp.]|nr:transcriptional regulator [Gallionella sp.]MDP1939502.1 transcriptional regulator [Gallionella sp.]